MPLDPTASAKILTAKGRLRDQVREARDQVAAEVARAAAHAAAQQLIKRPEINKATSFALYSAIRSELSTAPLAVELARRGMKLAYPRIAGPRQLAFHWVPSPDRLSSAGVWGIAEPAADAPAAAPGAVGIIIVPAIAFDSVGNRLGWGRGYYDAALAQHKDAIRVGFGFDLQLVEEVPAVSADAPLDLVVTESRAVVCSAGRLA